MAELLQSNLPQTLDIASLPLPDLVSLIPSHLTGDDSIPYHGFFLVGDIESLERPEPDTHLFKPPNLTLIWPILQNASAEGDGLWLDAIDTHVIRNATLLVPQSQARIDWLHVFQVGVVKAAEAARRRNLYCAMVGNFSSVQHDVQEIRRMLIRAQDIDKELQNGFTSSVSQAT